MTRLEVAYDRLPVFLQNAACEFEGWRVNRVRFGQGWANVRRGVAAREILSDAEFAEFRDERLRAFLIHAGESVQHYREEWGKLEIDVRSITGLSDLPALPVVRKVDVQERPRAFTTSRLSPARLQTVHTSGSTGAGLRFFTTRQAIQEQWATYWRYWGWHGITPT